MGRLIDAEDFRRYVHEQLEGNRPYTDDEILEMIDEQPTAFDADMVYRQMWCESEEVCGNTMIDLEVADEIVRNGGKER